MLKLNRNRGNGNGWEGYLVIGLLTLLFIALFIIMFVYTENPQPLTVLFSSSEGPEAKLNIASAWLQDYPSLWKRS